MAETDRKAYITKAGLDLYSKIQTGSTPLTITRVAVGDGTYSEQEILSGEMTALKSPVKIDTSIDYIRATGNGEAILSIGLSVSEKAFYLREIGVYATDPDVGEILYSYCSFGDTADYIESYNGLYSVFQRADIYIKIGNATDLRVDITDRAYATPEELRRAASVVTSTIYNNTAPSGNIIKITVPDMPADPYEQGNPDSLDNKMIAVSVGNYTATSDVADMKLSVNNQITDLWKFPIGKKGDTGKVQSFKAYEIRPNSILLIGIKDHYGYIANTTSAAKSAEEISDSTDNNTDYVTSKQVTNYVLDKEKYAFGNVYPIDINQVGSGNNILYINVPGVKSYDELDGKAVALNTGIYCVQWDTPQTVYININGLGNKALYRPLPSNASADYDTRQYNTDKYVKGEISRQQTLIVSFRKDSNVVTATLLNPAPAPRATKAVDPKSTDDVSYVTPKKLRAFAMTHGTINNESELASIDRIPGVYTSGPEYVDVNGDEFVALLNLDRFELGILGTTSSDEYIDEGQYLVFRMKNTGENKWTEWEDFLPGMAVVHRLAVLVSKFEKSELGYSIGACIKLTHNEGESSVLIEWILDDKKLQTDINHSSGLNIGTTYYVGVGMYDVDDENDVLVISDDRTFPECVDWYNTPTPIISFKLKKEHGTEIQYLQMTAYDFNEKVKYANIKEITEAVPDGIIERVEAIEKQMPYLDESADTFNEELQAVKDGYNALLEKEAEAEQGDS